MTPHERHKESRHWFENSALPPPLRLCFIVKGKEGREMERKQWWGEKMTRVSKTAAHDLSRQLAGGPLPIQIGTKPPKITAGAIPMRWHLAHACHDRGTIVRPGASPSVSRKSACVLLRFQVCAISALKAWNRNWAYTALQAPLCPRSAWSRSYGLAHLAASCCFLAYFFSLPVDHGK